MWKKLVVVFAVVTLIAINVVAYAATSSGVLTKAEYLNVQKRAYKELENSFEKSECGKFIKYLNGIDGAFNTEVGIEVKMPDTKTRKYVIKDNASYLERYEDGSFEGYVDGEKALSLEYVANEDNVSFKLGEVYDKFLTIDMTKLAELYENIYGVPYYGEISPKSMVYSCDLRNAIKLTKAEEKVLKNAKDKYYKMLTKELLQNSSFEKKSKEMLNINNSNYKCDVITYTVTTKQLVDGIEKVWTEFKNDKEVINLIWSKIKNVSDELAKLDSEYANLPTSEEVISDIDSFINRVKEEATEEHLIKSTLYHKSGKLLKKVITLSDSTEDVDVLTVCNSQSGKEKYFSVKLYDYVTVENKTADKNYTTTITLSPDDTPSVFVIEGREDNNGKHFVEIYSKDYDDVRVILKYENTASGSKEYGMKLDTKIEAYGETCELNADIKYKKFSSLKRKDIKNNEVKLNSLSSEEFYNLMEEIGEESDQKLNKAEELFFLDEIATYGSSFYDNTGYLNEETAMQIGKACRVWYTDFSTDISLAKLLTPYNGIAPDHWTRAVDLPLIGEYISKDIMHIGERYYYVTITVDDRIAVGLAYSEDELPETDLIEYDFDFDNVLYVE